ncbi:hypothetical protein TNCV_2040391 [Trichonephila clavipes]|nr:hypothetical protein TNCV_2040391 [Trichonephila clavipes]
MEKQCQHIEQLLLLSCPSQRESTMRGQGLLTSLPPTSRDDMRLDGYFEYPHVAKELHIYKQPCLIRDSNRGHTAQPSALLTAISDGRQSNSLSSSLNDLGEEPKAVNVL